MQAVKNVLSNNKSDSTAAAGSTVGSNEIRNSTNSSSGNVTGREASGDLSRHAEKPSLSGHSHNIENRHDLPAEGANSTHDHKHLAAVTKEAHHTHETEEVQRVREHDRHVHHVQHHVQPVLDTHHADREHTEHAHPITHIKESHVNTSADKDLLASHGAQHRDAQTIGGTDRTVVDRGETVHENVSHHVHHVVQPVIERDTHHHKTIHTEIPVKHTTHEAPIIHQSSTHEPMHLKDFTSQGGDLNSKLTHDQAGVLATGECQRTVDGPAERLADKLHLGSGSNSTSA